MPVPRAEIFPPIPIRPQVIRSFRFKAAFLVENITPISDVVRTISKEIVATNILT